MGRKVSARCLGLIVVLAVLMFAGCGTNSRSSGSGTGTSPGTGTGGTGGPGTGVASGPPRFLYFVMDAHPAVAPVNPDGTPGAVKEFPQPDGSERAVGSVAATPDGAHLYVSEFENTGNGLFYIAEFTIDRNTGDITHTTTIQVPNNGGLKVDPTGSVLAVAGNSNRTPEIGAPKLSMYKIASDGNLTAMGDPIPLYGQTVRDLQFDASGKHLFVLSSQADPATPGSSLQAFQIDSATGAATLLQSIPLSIDATQLAVAGSKYVYLSGVGDPGNDIAGWSIQGDGTLAPITGTPFGSGVNANGLAASPDGSRVYANDGMNQKIAWFSVTSTGALTLLGSTPPNTINVLASPFMMVDRSGKFLYSLACDPSVPGPGCAPVLWGGTIASDGSVTPMNGVPFKIAIYQWDIVY
jgi:hypothetical protein